MYNYLNIEPVLGSEKFCSWRLEYGSSGMRRRGKIAPMHLPSCRKGRLSEVGDCGESITKQPDNDDVLRRCAARPSLKKVTTRWFSQIIACITVFPCWRRVCRAEGCSNRWCWTRNNAFCGLDCMLLAARVWYEKRRRSNFGCPRYPRNSHQKPSPTISSWFVSLHFNTHCHTT